MEQNNNTDKKPGLSWSTPAASVKPLLPQKALPSAPTGGGSTGRYMGIFAAGIIVGVLVSWGYTTATKRTTDIAGTATTTETGKTNSIATQNSGAAVAGVTIGENGKAQSTALEVASPQKAGLSVSIRKATVSKPTWVVVYESRAGVPGNVLGAHLFFSTGAGTVTLLRATTAGAEYFVGMSPDNGDRKYSKAADKPAVTQAGSPEVVRFTAN